MRSGSRPGAMTYGATATRAKPSARRARTASSVRGRAAEANAGRTAHQPVCRHSRAISAITAIASGSVEPADASTTAVVARSAGVMPASDSRRSSASTSSGDGPRTSATETERPGRRVSASDSAAGMSAFAWKARVSSSGRATTSRTPSACSADSTCSTRGALKSRKAVSTRSPGRSARTRRVRACTVAACRGSRLPWAMTSSTGAMPVSSSPEGRGCAGRSVRGG